MPSGACVIRYVGKKGPTVFVKYRDASGRQVKERLGREADWPEPKAQQELGKRLDRVDRERWRKPRRLTFAAYAERFRREYLPGRGLKRSTLANYAVDLDRHLLPHFGPLELAAIEAEHVDGYIGRRRRPASPRRRSQTRSRRSG